MVAVAPSLTEQLVILEGISWDAYERLLMECDPSRGKRFTYDNGTLQIMVLSRRHEQPNRLLARIVQTLCEEWGLEIVETGSMTIRRSDLRRGFEPDSSFYIGKADAVRDKGELDFRVDPPPDLVIEVDITSGSLDKIPMFAAMGIPEAWRYDGRRVTIYCADGGKLVESSASRELAPLTAAILSDFVRQALEGGIIKWLPRLRQWARTNKR